MTQVPSSRRTLLKYAVSAPWIAGCRRKAVEAAPKIDGIVDELREVSASDLSKTVTRLRARASADELCKAAFMLPILTGGDAGDIHASAVIPSVRRLLPGKKLSFGPLFWAIENAHVWARLDRVSYPAKPVADPESALATALHEGTGELADQAMASLVRVSGLKPAAELMRLHACRPCSDPHVAIFAAQTSRMLNDLTPTHAALALRSVARYTATRSRGRQAPGNARGQTMHGFSRLARAVVQHRLSTLAPNDTLHSTTLFEALLHCHQTAEPAHKDEVLLYANQWLRNRMGSDAFDVAMAGFLERDQASAPTVLGFTRGMSLLRKEPKKLLGDVVAAVSDKPQDPHQFKYTQAILDVSKILEGEERVQWLAQLGTVPHLELFG